MTDEVVCRLVTIEQLREQGLTRSAIRWATRRGRLERLAKGVYWEGDKRPSRFDRAVAIVVSTGGIASGTMAGALLDFDGVRFRGLDVAMGASGSGRRRGAHRRRLGPDETVIIDGVRCTSPLRTLIDLADDLDDDHWEQALESVLRRGLATVDDVATGARGRRGARRIQRVLALRPPGAAPTGSLLETLMIQLARKVDGLPPPVRQLKLYAADDRIIARPDLAWPDLGLFIELDGEQHKNQPVYDASRETAVVAATGWLCGRFTWTEVNGTPKSTAKRLGQLADQARARPMTSHALARA